MDASDLRLIDTALTDPRRRRLAACGQLRRYPRHALLIQEGDVGDTLYVVLAGRLKSYSQDLHGREITYAIVEPGQFVGEMSLDGGPRCASVVALEPSVCAVLDRATLRDFVAREPEFAFELLAVVIDRARRATESARTLALLDVYGRLVRLLESMAEPHAGGVRVVRQRPTHQDIANRIGASREMVSRIMKDLAVGGYVEAAGESLLLRKPLPASW